MPRPRAFLLMFALLTVALSGCSKDDKPTTTEQLPAGGTLMSEAVTATNALKSAHVKIDTEGEVGNLPLRRADGDLLRSGDAKGTIQLSQFGLLIESDFVVFGKSVYLKAGTGGWQKLSAADTSSIYDPSAILDPNRGIGKLLSTATNPTTEAKESIDGKDTYRVAVKLDSAAVSTLVPGITGDVTGKLWLDTQSKNLTRAILTVPGQSGKTGTVTINVTAIDVPVTVSAPQ